MATYIALISFTDQGIRNVKDSPDRYENFKAMAKKLGIIVKSAYWTSGSYDMIVVVDGTVEVAMAALMKVRSLGNVRTQTLRGFSIDEMRRMLNNLP